MFLVQKNYGLKKALLIKTVVLFNNMQQLLSVDI